MSDRTITLTTCTRDCPDACGMRAFVTGGKVVGLTGNNDHEYTHTYLCRKAANYIHRVYSPDRVLNPRVKVNGVWTDVSWDAALTLIADRTKKTIDQYGSLALLHYQSAGSLGAMKMLNKRFFNLLGGVTEASGSLCGGAGIAGQTLDFGYRTCHDPYDLLNSRVILLWGRNPSETNMHLLPILKDAHARGAKIALIDPLKTDSAKFCDLHVAPKPGTDGYLALAMAKVIIDRGLEDREFIDKCCDNFDEYRRLVESKSMDELSGACGVSADLIQTLAMRYAETKPGSIILGWGMQRYEWGAETFRLIDALGAITGNIGVAGGGVNHGRDESEFFDQSLKGKEFAKHTRRIDKAVLGKELQQLDNPPVKMAFINGANPLNQSPDIDSVKKAFAEIDFIVVFEQFMTDTAEAADVVLPVTTYLEEADVIGSYWHTYVGLVNPAVEPQGQTRSDFAIYQALAERLGYGAEMAGSPEEWIRRLIKPLKEDGITYDKLLEGNLRIASIPMVPFADRIFKTTTGKFNLIKEFTQPALGTREYPLVLLSTHTRQWMHSQVLPNEQNEPPTARVHPSSALFFDIGDGESATVVSPVGDMPVIVHHDEKIKEGVVHVNQGRWAKYNQSPNQLTSAIMSRDGHNASYYQTTVRLQKTQ